MTSKHNDFIEDAENFINNSDWLLNECEKIFNQFKETDFDTTDPKELEKLLAKMDYLQGKINAEKSIYENFREKHQDYM